MIEKDKNGPEMKNFHSSVARLGLRKSLLLFKSEESLKFENCHRLNSYKIMIYTG